jgi:hypothetical protein
MDKAMNNLALESKKKNIIDMAFGFTVMARVFEKESDDLIKGRLAQTFQELKGIDSEQKFQELHHGFCEWFAQTIKLAKGGGSAAYGHGAKVLDISLKVYVYYCGLPDQAKADYLTPLLNGAIDTPILRHLVSTIKTPDGQSLSPHLRPRDILANEIVLYTRKSKNSNLTSRKIPRPVCLPDGFSGFHWKKYPRFLERRTKGGWGFHNLRHRYAAYQHSRGMPLYLLMERLGHSNLSTTQIYLRSLPSFCPDGK